jgi:CRP/FNR family transcriptional regulator
LSALDNEARAAIAGRGRTLDVPAGGRVFAAGETPQAFLLVLEGRVRVQQISESGREIVLYRLAAGEACTLTTSCLLGSEPYPAEAHAETETRALALPRPVFDELMARSASFRGLVFNQLGRRIADLMRLIDDIAFGRMDIRLADRLLVLAGADGRVPLTQQQLAVELGTAREVVGRVLSELERRGLASHGRGFVQILDRAGLERLARQP